MKHLITRMNQEQAQAETVSFAIQQHLEIVLVAVEDESPIEQAMLQPIEQDITALQGEVERLQALLADLQSPQ
jgi:hypothetical protein